MSNSPISDPNFDLDMTTELTGMFTPHDGWSRDGGLQFGSAPYLSLFGHGLPTDGVHMGSASDEPRHPVAWHNTRDRSSKLGPSQSWEMPGILTDANRASGSTNDRPPLEVLKISTPDPSPLKFSAPCIKSTIRAEVESVSPSQTCFDDNQSPYTHSVNLFKESESSSTTSSHSPVLFPHSTSSEFEGYSAKRRDSASLETGSDESLEHKSSSPPSRRRRSSAEPGSARAIYLEKNRQAASKCRSKQKRQQEELVERTRMEERRNKHLKAEVEFLKEGMRDLMEIVAQHTQCPDRRLSTYVQREADRLMARERPRSGHNPPSVAGSPDG